MPALPLTGAEKGLQHGVKNVDGTALEAIAIIHVRHGGCIGVHFRYFPSVCHFTAMEKHGKTSSDAQEHAISSMTTGARA